jgi:hypothetical protein
MLTQSFRPGTELFYYRLSTKGHMLLGLGFSGASARPNRTATIADERRRTNARCPFGPATRQDNARGDRGESLPQAWGWAVAPAIGRNKRPQRRRLPAYPGRDMQALPADRLSVGEAVDHAAPTTRPTALASCIVAPLRLPMRTPVTAKILPASSNEIVSSAFSISLTCDWVVESMSASRAWLMGGLRLARHDFKSLMRH